MKNYITKLSPHFSERTSDIEYIIIHATFGGDAEGTVNWFCHPNSLSSAHRVISRSGMMTETVKLEDVAWHCGSSTTFPNYNGIPVTNNNTIGIELSNWLWMYKATKTEEVTIRGEKYTRKKGELYTRGRRWTHPYTIKGNTYDTLAEHPMDNKAIRANKYYPGDSALLWERYTDIQYIVLAEAIDDILRQYPKLNVDRILQHSDIDPTRKVDCGPEFSMDRLKGLISHGSEEEFSLGRRKSDKLTTEEMQDDMDIHRGITRKKPLKTRRFWWFGLGR